jgi:predicted phage terminase large subunit-like protein
MQASEVQLGQMLGNYRLTPATLMTKLDPTWIAAPWLQYLSMRIAHAVARGNCGILISAPPRHGKSTLATKALPLWVMENFPNKNVVICTYGDDLSTDFSRDIKDFIEGSEGKLSIRLRPDVKRVAHFQATNGSSLKAVGMGGAITGRGADVLIIDDYIKNPKEATSATYLEGLWHWFTTVARTRLEPGAVVILVATRWVTNDLHGRIQERQKISGKTFYEDIKIPAIAVEGDPLNAILGREVGDPLFPERYNVESLLEIKDEVGARWFNAMFQQEPDADESSATSMAWLENKCLTDIGWQEKFASTPPAFWRAGRGWDLASTKEAGDFTAAPLLYYNLLTEEVVFVDLRHGQYGPNEVEEVFKSTSGVDPAFVQYAIDREPGSAGITQVKHFRELVAPHKRKLQDYPATVKKFLRAQPVLAAMEAGKFYYLERPWNMKFTSEFKKFPEGETDDIMDGLSVIYNHLSGKKPAAGTWGRKSAQTTPDSVTAGSIIIPGVEEIAQVHQSRTDGSGGPPKPRASVCWGRGRSINV